MRVVYTVGDGPLEGATYALERVFRSPRTSSCPSPKARSRCTGSARTAQVWFVHLLPETV